MPHVRSFDLRVPVPSRTRDGWEIAATRALLWERLDEFVTHVTCGAARP